MKITRVAASKHIVDGDTNHNDYHIENEDIKEIKEQHNCVKVYFNDNTVRKIFNHEIILIDYVQ